MKLNKVSKTILLSVWCPLMFLSGCEYDKGYKEIWPTDNEGAPEPKITSVKPDSAYGGVTELQLIGENFSPVVGENFVYFGTIKGVVQAASATQLMVIRPIAAGGSLTIQLAVRDALRTTTYGPYKLEQGVVDVGELGRVYAIALDRNENLYAHQENKTVVKVTPDGQQTQYDIADFKSSAMRMGPDGTLYIQRYNHKNLYRIPPGGGSGAVEKFTIKDKG
ncbi:MAG: IPT/TIG domain-containing protein, partial [candidate division KSB1 bacterium]|nr:IPT/TIG domain-containing protein [candidate division KSB1 bacterium]